MAYEERFMKEALKLAERGRGKTAPNPMVGAVIVKDGIVAGRGWHERAGGPHAEIRALQEAGLKAAGADLYVTLEPCCHTGKTPPCTGEIIKVGIKNVYAAVKDPNPKVAGRGLAQLREEGIGVSSGHLAKEATRQNEAFFKYIRTRIPFVMLKLALSLDGRLADSFGASKWITGEEARNEVQHLRSGCDAVMTGIGTALLDDPGLDVRLSRKNKDPLRVIADTEARLSKDSRLAATAGNVKTLLAVSEKADKKRIAALERKGIEIGYFREGKGGLDLLQILEHLGSRDIMSLLVEGGAGLASSFLEQELADKCIIFFAPVFIGGSGNNILLADEARRLEDRLLMRIGDVRVIGEDVRLTVYPKERK